MSQSQENEDIGSSVTNFGKHEFFEISAPNLDCPDFNRLYPSLEYGFMSSNCKLMKSSLLRGPIYNPSDRVIHKRKRETGEGEKDTN